MGDTLNTVVNILDESGEVDNQATFDALWSIMSAQADRIRDHFELEVDPGYADLETYGPDDGWRGVLNAYSGPKMDWMIHSWMGDPGTGFTNMHLTCWLGPDIDVPHLGFAWGTLPTLWFYQDYMPRVDMGVDYDYLQKYYEPTNERFLDLKADEGLSYFTSRTLVVRQQVSETGYCFVCTDADEGEQRAVRIDQIARLAEQRVTDWLAMVDAADAVPADKREALAERDLHVRRLIAETDPANVVGERYYGEELTARLVGALWGAERQLDRPGS
ncbi:MAG: oxidoreductase [Actinomycetia bacterium]|nr:oxidoreductase [Actinomycetes bacterium]